MALWQSWGKKILIEDRHSVLLRSFTEENWNDSLKLYEAVVRLCVLAGRLYAQSQLLPSHSTHLSMRFLCSSVPEGHAGLISHYTNTG